MTYRVYIKNVWHDLHTRNDMYSEIDPKRWHYCEYFRNTTDNNKHNIFSLDWVTGNLCVYGI